MTTQSEIVLLQLREMLMRGDFNPGEHLQEIPLAKRLDVSRTPVRLALGTLAQEGLLVHKPQRGFLVRQFSIKEIIDAVDVRGQLEAMACRIVGSAGLAEDVRRILGDCVSQMAEIISDEPVEFEKYPSWFDLNGRFHQTIVEATENPTLLKFIAQIDNVPLASAKVIAATARNSERISQVFAQSQKEHEQILDALTRKQSGRAEALMLEHVFQGREGLRRYLERLRDSREPHDAPFMQLISS